MSYKATIRAIEAAQRREQREAQRRFRELEHQAKEHAKLSAIEQARLEVETFENQVDVLLSVHKEQSDVWDWTAIAASLPRPLPHRNSHHELRTKTWLELDRLLAEDWHKVNDASHEAQSQAFGRAAHDIGAEALLIPSARVPGGMNLVYFPRSLAARSRIDIFGEDVLNRWIRNR